jgi:hypothetical protein
MMRADGHEVSTSTVQRALRRRGPHLRHGAVPGTPAFPRGPGTP